MTNTSKPKVSVLMVAYKNSEYTEQAIESVLSQTSNFPIELVIGEDASPDDTPAMIRRYLERNTGNVTIRARFNETNLGLIKNFALTLSECRGDYVAILDNDDYWTDPLKLQRQVDFLESNPEFSMCYHPVQLLKKNKLGPDTEVRDTPEVSDIYELAKGNFIRINSAVFRACAFNGFPESYFKSPVNDYFLWMIVASYGPIKRLPQTMAVYRIHSGGVWSLYDQQDLKILDYLETIIGCFGPKIDQLLIERHQKVAYASLMKRVGESGFKERLLKCTQYGESYLHDKLAETSKWEQRVNKSFVLRNLRRLLVNS